MPPCRQCEAPGLHKCVACRSVFYCSAECQKADWRPRHKAECKAFAADRDELATLLARLQDPTASAPFARFHAFAKLYFTCAPEAADALTDDTAFYVALHRLAQLDVHPVHGLLATRGDGWLLGPMLHSFALAGLVLCGPVEPSFNTALHPERADTFLNFVDETAGIAHGDTFLGLLRGAVAMFELLRKPGPAGPHWEHCQATWRLLAQLSERAQCARGMLAGLARDASALASLGRLLDVGDEQLSAFEGLVNVIVAALVVHNGALAADDPARVPDLQKRVTVKLDRPAAMMFSTVALPMARQAIARNRTTAPGQATNALRFRMGIASCHGATLLELPRSWEAQRAARGAALRAKGDPGQQQRSETHTGSGGGGSGGAGAAGGGAASSSLGGEMPPCPTQ